MLDSPEPSPGNPPEPGPTAPPPAVQDAPLPPGTVYPASIDPGLALCAMAAGLRLLAAAGELLGPCADLARDPGAEPRARAAAQSLCWVLVRAEGDGAEDDRIERACAGVREMLLPGGAAPAAPAPDVLGARAGFARLARWLETGGANNAAAGLPLNLRVVAQRFVAAYFDLLDCVDEALDQGAGRN